MKQNASQLSFVAVLRADFSGPDYVCSDILQAMLSTYLQSGMRKKQFYP